MQTFVVFVCSSVPSCFFSSTFSSKTEWFAMMILVRYLCPLNDAIVVWNPHVKSNVRPSAASTGGRENAQVVVVQPRARSRSRRVDSCTHSLADCVGLGAEQKQCVVGCNVANCGL